MTHSSLVYSGVSRNRFVSRVGKIPGHDAYAWSSHFVRYLYMLINFRFRCPSSSIADSDLIINESVTPAEEISPNQFDDPDLIATAF
jgi:hypothetical protein